MEINMKTLGYIATVAGFILLAGTAGNSDFYERCIAAPDCVAGDPQSMASIVIQLVSGLILMAGGLFVVTTLESSDF